jgi:hypothetical protein
VGYHRLLEFDIDRQSYDEIQERGESQAIVLVKVINKITDGKMPNLCVNNNFDQFLEVRDSVFKEKDKDLTAFITPLLKPNNTAIFLKSMINHLISINAKHDSETQLKNIPSNIFLLDLDLQSPFLSPPGCLSLIQLTSPLLSPHPISPTFCLFTNELHLDNLPHLLPLLSPLLSHLPSPCILIANLPRSDNAYKRSIYNQVKCLLDASELTIQDSEVEAKKWGVKERVGEEIAGGKLEGHDYFTAVRRQM